MNLIKKAIFNTAIFSASIPTLLAPVHSYATDNETHELYKKCAIEAIEQNTDPSATTYKASRGNAFKVSRFKMSVKNINGASFDVITPVDKEQEAYGSLQYEYEGATAVANIPDLKNTSVKTSKFSFLSGRHMPIERAPESVEAMKRVRGMVSAFMTCTQ